MELYFIIVYTAETLNVENCDKEKQVHGTKTITDSYANLNHQYVLDGGSLLHRICWAKGKTYGEIAVSCSQFVLHKYDKAIVIFDGYDTHPSTKDITHLRRTNRFSQREVIFTDKTISSLPKEEFLTHPKNKSKFAHLLGEKLTQAGCRVIHSNDDADHDIAITSVQESLTNIVTVIGEDTDLLVLLLYFSYQSSHFKLLFRSDRDNKKKDNTIFDVYQYSSILGNELCNALLFIYAFSGCDTTSQFHNIGKGTTLDMFAKSSKLPLFAQTFMSPTSTHQDIEKNGEDAVLLLYKANQGESIIGLRKRLFLEKLAKAKSFVKPERLPPTCSSLRYHSFRMYYQILK